MNFKRYSAHIKMKCYSSTAQVHFKSYVTCVATIQGPALCEALIQCLGFEFVLWAINGSDTVGDTYINTKQPYNNIHHFMVLFHLL